MERYQQQFIDQAIASNALCFGEFTLKSGRVSPYFFNAGLIYQGRTLATVSRCYAEAISRSGVACDMLFGPAYKGIALAATTVCALADQQGRDLPYAYNRKEAKSHGEGGQLVGAPLRGDVLIIDDVITAGTAIREAINLIRAEGARVSGVVIGLDRQERGQGELSAIQELEREYKLEVVSIIKLDNIVEYLRYRDAGDDYIEKLENYRATYGV